MRSALEFSLKYGRPREKSYIVGASAIRENLHWPETIMAINGQEEPHVIWPRCLQPGHEVQPGNGGFKEQRRKSKGSVHIIMPNPKTSMWEDDIATAFTDTALLLSYRSRSEDKILKRGNRSPALRSGLSRHGPTMRRGPDTRQLS